MRNTLIDAGPLIALFDRGDRYHLDVVGFLEHYRGRLVSTLPVVTEACHMLDFSVKAQLGLLRWIERGGVELFGLDASHFARIIALGEKYADLPMDFADGTLIVAGEVLGIREILTIDSDYDVYRTLKKEPFVNLLRKGSA